MAKLTKQQQKEQRELEEKQSKLIFIESYQQKLLDILYQSIKGDYFDLETDEKSGSREFLFITPDREVVYRLPYYGPDMSNVYSIINECDSIINEIENIEYHRSESKRIADLKVSALSKLSKEEREVLGLK